MQPHRVTRTLRVIFAYMTAVGLLAGCASTSTASSGGAVTAQSETGVVVSGDAVAPRELTGPVTAELPTATIAPITTAPSPVLPARVVDAQGTEVVVGDTSRILALDLYGTLARIVFDLGLGDSVVGRDTSTVFAEAEHLPLVTVDGHTLSAEAIIELAPSVILTDTSLGPWDVMLQLREAGIAVVVLDSHRSIDTVAPLITQVAAALGVASEGEQLAARTQVEIDAALSAADAAMPSDPDDRPRVAFLYVRGQAGVYYLFGRGSGADSLITAAGGRDVASEIGWDGMHPVTDEGLVSAAPDAIVMMTGGLESVGGVDGLLTKLPALAQTPAGEHRRIIDMADADILSFGPASAAIVTSLNQALLTPGAAS